MRRVGQRQRVCCSGAKAQSTDVGAHECHVARECCCRTGYLGERTNRRPVPCSHGACLGQDPQVCKTSVPTGAPGSGGGAYCRGIERSLCVSVVVCLECVRYMSQCRSHCVNGAVSCYRVISCVVRGRHTISRAWRMRVRRPACPDTAPLTPRGGSLSRCAVSRNKTVHGSTVLYEL